MFWIILSSVFFIVGIWASIFFYYYGRRVGVLTSRGYYHKYYRDKVIPESASYSVGLKDGITKARFDHIKTLMTGSSEPVDLSESDVKLLASGGKRG